MERVPQKSRFRILDTASTWNCSLYVCFHFGEHKYQLLLTLVIDNHRVLHGRSSFDGNRRMCGAYIGIDEYRSKLAVLTETFAPDLVLQATSELSNAVVNGRSVWNNSL